MRDTRRAGRAGGRRGGFTFVELMISLVLGGTVAASAALLLTTTARAYGTASTAFDVEAAGGRALHDVCRILRRASVDNVIPTGIAAPLNLSQIEFRVGVGVNNSKIVWGDVERIRFEYGPEDPDDGLDNDGDGFVDEGRIVHLIRPGAADEQRIVLCNNVLEALAGEVPGNVFDDNGNGLEDEAGLSFDFEDGHLNVRLSVGRLDPEGQPIVRTFEQVVAFRNYGS